MFGEEEVNVGKLRLPICLWRREPCVQYKAKYFIVIFKEKFLKFTSDIFDYALSLFNNSVCDVLRQQIPKDNDQE